MYEILFDELRFPVAPESLKLKINNQNETIQLISGQEINIPRLPGLSEFEFTLLLPAMPYSFAVYPEGFQPPEFYTEKLKAYKVGKTPFQFIVNRALPGGAKLFGTDMTVVLEEYSIEEDAGNGFDVKISIRLKQYEKRTAVEYTVTTTPEGEEALVAEPERPAKEPERTYTVKKGDCLYNICKKELGNGNRYPEIAKLNGIPNPSLIYPGQVIRFE